LNTLVSPLPFHKSKTVKIVASVITLFANKISGLMMLLKNPNFQKFITRKFNIYDEKILKNGLNQQHH